jgi:uncharacterized protein YjbI with pentapeptide repeats
MTDAQALCGFKPPEEFGDPDYQCRHPARQDGLCLFHLFKPTEEQKEARTAAEAIEEEFHQAFSKFLEDEERNPEADICDFRYFRFPAIDLSQRRFAKPLGLTGATFSGEANFLKAAFSEGTTFNGEADDFGNAGFHAATFSGRANFRGATFGGVADFRDATFSGGANFVEAIFSGGATFSAATFSGYAGFSGAIFSEGATFSGAAFSEEANFGGAAFSWGADFFDATFSEEAYFRGATFSEEADFVEADFSAVVFSGKANFGEAIFSGKASFRETTFSGEASFRWGTTFSGEADFREAIFSGKAAFPGETFQDVCLFTGVALDEKAEVVFKEKANLTQASFLDTNLERIHFRDVKWPHKDSRQVLWDEFLHKGGQPDYEKVAENYRQLVINYEAKRDFDTAEDFHIGEMEMRRKKKGKQAEDEAAKAKWLGMKLLWRCWGVINGYSIYKFLSNYGTSYLQGLLVLGMLLVLFSGIFLWSGLKPSKEHIGSLRAINYEPCLHTACQRPWQQKVRDSAKAIVFTLSLLTFQKDRLYEPANACTQLWICIAVPLLAGQTALVLFAIRRRFKR